MMVSVGEMIDRLTILLLKQAHGALVEDELRVYAEGLCEDDLWGKAWVQKEFLELFFVNAAIWQLEWQVRQGREGELSLEEIGRRALAIRDLNAQRVAAKNRLASATGGYREQKIDHASEDTP